MGGDNAPELLKFAVNQSNLYRPHWRSPPVACRFYGNRHYT